MDKSNRISILNNKFVVNGKQIWINGTNTPWNIWNDFGGAYNDKWWDSQFAELHKTGVNAARVWINCNNNQGAVYIDNNGMISGVSDAHWADLDKFFQTAERHQIYIMATIVSFDHFKYMDEKRKADAEKWRNMLRDKAAAESFVERYTLPFLERYKDKSCLWSIDICNEPDWVFENQECGQLPWEHISYFLAVNTAAIHEHSGVLVTVGFASPKYYAEGPDCTGNKVSDTFLQNLYPNKNAYLDFWSPHYYDWVGEHYGVPFYLKPDGIRNGNSKDGFTGGWCLEPSKPAVIGECCAKGTGKNLYGITNNTIITDYEQAYFNGWQGVMTWTSNGVDGNGKLEDFAPAVMNMLEKYPQLVFPFGNK